MADKKDKYHITLRLGAMKQVFLRLSLIEMKK